MTLEKDTKNDNNINVVEYIAATKKTLTWLATSFLETVETYAFNSAPPSHCHTTLEITANKKVNQQIEHPLRRRDV